MHNNIYNYQSDAEEDQYHDSYQLAYIEIPISQLPRNELLPQHNNIAIRPDDTMYCSIQMTAASLFHSGSFFSGPPNEQKTDVTPTTHRDSVQRKKRNYYHPYLAPLSPLPPSRLPTFPLLSPLSPSFLNRQSTDFSPWDMRQMMRESLKRNKVLKREERLDKLFDECHDTLIQKPENLKDYFARLFSLIQHEVQLANKWPDTPGKKKLCQHFNDKDVRVKLFTALIQPLTFLLVQLPIEDMTWLIEQSASKWCARPELIYVLENTFFSKLDECSIDECKNIATQLGNLCDQNNAIIKFSGKLIRFIVERQSNNLSINL